MSGNGGHKSSLQAATSGSPPFDPGLRVPQNQKENGRRNSPSQGELQVSQPGGFIYHGKNTQSAEDFVDEQMNDLVEASPLSQSDRHRTSSSASARTAFPMGINQPFSSLNTSTTITPQARTVKRYQRSGGDLRSVEEDDEIEIIEIEAGQATPMQAATFRKASSLLQREEEKVLKMLPEKVQPALSSIKTYTFIAEIHFNKPISEKGIKMDASQEYNLPTCLGQWIKKTRETAPEFSLLSYREEAGGNPITHEDQIPKDDCEAINLYFHNHRVENNGILKGMVRFTTTIPWMELKDQRKPYFKWLSANRIFLRHTSFDADSLVLLGYLHDAHPEASRLTDMTNELKERLQLPEGVDFQVTPRNLSVLDSQVTKTKFGFKAIAVETDSKMAGPLREAFFRLGDPKVAKHQWPITGNCLFVPMYKTTAWTTETIASMAKVHTRNLHQLEQIFVDNIFDIDTKITFTEPGGTEQVRSLRSAIQSSTSQDGVESVVHSVHNTNRAGVIQILVTAANVEHAKNFFGDLHTRLRSVLSPEDLAIVTRGKTIQLTDRIHESSDSKTYAGYAAAILRENPQDGLPVDTSNIASPQRKKTRMEISYSTMAKRALDTSIGRRNHATGENPVDFADLDNLDQGWEATDDWEQKLHAGFKKLFGDQPPLRAEDVEQKMQEAINRQAAESEKRLDRKFSTFSLEMKQFTMRENEKAKRTIQTMFEQQNQLIINLTTRMQSSLLQVHENITGIAYQTNASLVYTDIPKIDVRNTSPVAQRQENIESTGLSDAAT